MAVYSTGATGIREINPVNPTSSFPAPSIRYEVNQSQINRLPGRSLLPIVEMKLKGRNVNYLCKALLDIGSEINIMNRKCCNWLQLKVSPLMINIVGAGGVMSKRYISKHGG